LYRRNWNNGATRPRKSLMASLMVLNSAGMGVGMGNYCGDGMEILGTGWREEIIH